MKGMLKLKKSVVIAAVCMAVLCVSVYGQGAPLQDQKKVLGDAGGMIEKFLQKGKYIKCYNYGGEEGLVYYVLVANIISAGIANNKLSILWGGFGFSPLDFDLSENSISLDGDCNIIIKPKK